MVANRPKNIYYTLIFSLLIASGSGIINVDVGVGGGSSGSGVRRRCCCCHRRHVGPPSPTKRRRGEATTTTTMTKGRVSSNLSPPSITRYSTQRIQRPLSFAIFHCCRRLLPYRSGDGVVAAVVPRISDVVVAAANNGNNNDVDGIPGTATFDRRYFLSSLSSMAAVVALTLASSATSSTAAAAEADDVASTKHVHEDTYSSSGIESGSIASSSFYVADEMYSKRTDIRYFIAGGACAAISHGVATPVDVIKTRIQAEPEIYGGGVRKAALKILNKDGPRALLGGLGPTLVGYCIEGALKFGVYEALKPVMLSLLPSSVDPAEPYLLAAVVAGALASVLLCPIEETRIRVVTDPSFAKGLVDGLPKLVQEEGVFSIFSGIYAMFSKQVPYTMAKQVSFDEFTNLIYPVLAGYAWLPAYELKLGVDLCAAFLASIIACVASHPGDVLLTSTYKKGHGSKSFRELVSGIYQSKGIEGFFQGLSARFIHVGAIITLQLVLYDEIKALLGLPSTGP